MHEVCGNPIKSRWINAVKAGNFVGWPLLNEKNVQNTTLKPSKQTWGTQTRYVNMFAQPNPSPCHLKKLIQRLCMVKRSRMSMPKYTAYMKPFFHIRLDTSPPDPNWGTYTLWQWWILIAMLSSWNQWPARKTKIWYKQRIHWYYDWNNQAIYPKKHVLDNLEAMKNHIRDDLKFNVELVPPRCHRRNAVKEAICNFKSHFLSILAGTSDNFLPGWWDCLLPQTTITLNLLHQFNATPTVSTYAHLSGPFDYNKMPQAPMGFKAQIHEKLTNKADCLITA